MQIRGLMARSRSSPIAALVSDHRLLGLYLAKSLDIRLRTMTVLGLNTATALEIQLTTQPELFGEQRN
jgi:hypothetical protein